MFFRKSKPKPAKRQRAVDSPLRRALSRRGAAAVEIVHAKLEASEPLMLADDRALGFDPYNSKDKD